jgi:hypothetical protein
LVDQPRRARHLHARLRAGIDTKAELPARYRHQYRTGTGGGAVPNLHGHRAAFLTASCSVITQAGGVSPQPQSHRPRLQLRPSAPPAGIASPVARHARQLAAQCTGSTIVRSLAYLLSRYRRSAALCDATSDTSASARCAESALEGGSNYALRLGS